MIYWKEELKVRGSRLRQFYYWLITDFITEEAEQNKLKRRDTRLENIKKMWYDKTQNENLKENINFNTYKQHMYV